MSDVVVLTGRGADAVPRLILFAPETTAEGFSCADYCAIEDLPVGAELMLEGTAYLLSEPILSGLHCAPILRVLTNEPHQAAPITLSRAPA